MASTNEHITVDIFSTQPPKEVLEPHGPNNFAIGDGAHEQSERKLSIVELKMLEAHAEGAAVEARRASVIDRDLYPLPTDEERESLRKIPDSIPMVSYALCIVEFAERATYYGVTTVFSNFMEFPLPKGGNGSGAPPRGSQETAGALGKGLQFSSALSLLFTFLAYAIPIFGGWVADSKLGRYKTIAVGVIICGVAHIILIAGAAPSVLRAGHGVAPFMIGLFTLAIGAGMFKPNIAPTVLDQYTHQRQYTKVLSSGEKVIVDPEATVQRIMLVFYALINIGAFFALATTYCEKDVGYWLAFLTPGILYFLLPILLIVLYRRTIKNPPNGTILNNFFIVTWYSLVKSKCAVWKKGFWDVASPSTLPAEGVTTLYGKPITWNDKFITDCKRTFAACAIFLYVPIWTLNDGGIGAVGSNQAASMTTNGAPNDLLGNFNPLTIIIFIPILNYGLYPMLRRYKIKFGRISRMTVGFVICAVSGVIGAIVQWRVYETSPCGYQASTCTSLPVVPGTGVSPLSVWLQIPNVALGAISECFVNVTAYEMAYARAPKGMKALVMALFLFMNALASALSEILVPAIVDPHLIWVWAGPAIALFVQTGLFWWQYRGANDDEFMTYEDEVETLEEARRNSVLVEKEGGDEVVEVK